tara:strand:+ start:15 stop:197 length:183 start_codon:yes stop_codon:yes gene_type:complete
MLQAAEIAEKAIMTEADEMIAVEEVTEVEEVTVVAVMEENVELLNPDTSGSLLTLEGVME